METVLLVIHLLIALAIIGLVLLQRSEGGGLGIGGGSGGMGSLATAGQTKNVLSRATGIFAFLFFCTSLSLAIMAGRDARAPSLLDRLDETPAAAETPAAPVVDTDAAAQDEALEEADPDNLPEGAVGNEEAAPMAPDANQPVPAAPL